MLDSPEEETPLYGGRRSRLATQFGIWELGRFAREYQILFGELPSSTLCRGY